MSQVLDTPQTFFVGLKGIVVKDDKVLLLKKSGERAFWDAPGGRINHGEDLIQAIHRELREELPSATDIAVGRLLHVHVLDRLIKDDVGLTLVFYKVDVAFKGEPLLSAEHSEFSWMTFDEAREAASEGIVAAIDALRG